MELSKAYDPTQYEDELYKRWEDSGAFSPDFQDATTPPSQPFVIAMPPPNATGQLHMGHAVTMALQDLMTRYHRMKGDDTLWIPGTDHAGIATQNMAEKLLKKEQNKSRHDLGRDAFVEYTRDFAENSKTRIRTQIRKMGSSCDWSRERYTLDDGLNLAVRTAFARMYEDGLVYRGYRIVNWCTRCSSTLADDEVEYKHEKTKFYYLKYGPVIIGTARPETKFADKVIIVHPKDKRYKQYVGKTLTVPWITGDVEATFIADESADMEMGSGAMTITPAHSFIDFDLAQKYKIEVLKIIDENGLITAAGGSEFEGLHVKEAREKVVAKLTEKGLVDHIDENYEHNLSVCYRCKTPIEPLPSEQWFVAVNKASKQLGGKTIKERALEVVRSKEITILPERFEKTYFHWMENLRDWCISRQIWWGHRIPAWRCASCDVWTVAVDTPAACTSCTSMQIHQDADTLDTWFSSALWTFSTLGWPASAESTIDKPTDLKRFHPTTVMETGYDILFFWVARMIIMSTYHLDQIPFQTVYLHGLVRDRDGDKMSKSKPETMIDPLEMCVKYGTDATRLSLVIGSTPGNDVRLFEEKIAGYRNFTNKVWNVARFILMNCDTTKRSTSSKELVVTNLADHWILSRLQRLISETTTTLDTFRFSDGGMRAYEFLWNELADWYVEMSKVEKNDAILMHVLETVLKLLHPWMPFVTEQIWKEMGHTDMLMTAPWPIADKARIDEKAEKQMQSVIDVVTGVRSLRASAGIDPATKMQLTVVSDLPAVLEEKRDIIMKLAKLSSCTITDTKPAEKTLHHTTANSQLYLHITGVIDLDAERAKTENEIADTQRYITSIETRLGNKAFVAKAPDAVISGEREKLAQAQEKLTKLTERLVEFS